jgi:hypothetical protein
MQVLLIFSWPDLQGWEIESEIKIDINNILLEIIIKNYNEKENSIYLK